MYRLLGFCVEGKDAKRIHPLPVLQGEPFKRVAFTWVALVLWRAVTGHRGYASCGVRLGSQQAIVHALQQSQGGPSSKQGPGIQSPNGPFKQLPSSRSFPHDLLAKAPGIPASTATAASSAWHSVQPGHKGGSKQRRRRAAEVAGLFWVRPFLWELLALWVCFCPLAIPQEATSSKEPLS